MDSGDLRVFEAVARLGAMNRAAQELNTVQSNVTARIRVLEDALGVPLFERHARGVTVTPAGGRLLPYARDIGRLMVEAAAAARDDGDPRGRLVIGSLETTAALRLSPSLSAFATRWPAVDLVLRTGTTAELIQAVAAGTLEGAFACGPVSDPALEAEAVFAEELVVLAAPGRFWLEPDAVEPPRIVVLRAGCSYRERLEHVLLSRGVARPRLLEFGTLETIISSVAAGLGITLLPAALIGRVWSDERVSVHRLPPAEARVETVYVRRRGARLSSAAAALLDLVRENPDVRAGGALRRAG